ncbi:MAG: M42 family metallopeptidase [Candidatus Fermentithermobacillus carboniphilus]|uniref:M42 family metallopeptidase n=1 Tax=Candidatus Fermentithermobacillus carboniphilus TaxID=3085328 RepID=A0AAT9LH34_9FIRM|nr:MAG: M42 family metallopeptidase [Candidatus Fermentithermobacillus carboniphilus]
MSVDDRLVLLKEISELPGVPGYEDEVRKYIKGRMAGLAEVYTDNLGSVICRKEGSAAAPKIMMAGHMDEIGMMVTYITKEGFLKFQTLGGWWEQVMLAQRVVVKTSSGDVLGLIGSKPPHILKQEERKKVVEKTDMFIDIGASSKEEAESMGVRPGDPVIPVSPFAQMKNPKYLVGKAWDNRIGCAIFMEAIKELQGVPHPNTIYGVGTVQEEVGLRGATTSVSLVEPDIGFALEVDIAGDTPGIHEHEAQAKLGKGPSILLYDASMVPHRRLRDFVVETAKSAGIPIQFNAMPGGGTDAGRIHVYKSGVPSLVIGVPTRYIHSHAGIIHRDDFDNAVRLIVEVIKRLDAAALSAIRGE